MVHHWEEMRAAFARSSDARTAVVGGLAGGVGGAVGALAGTGDVYARLALTAVVAVAVAFCLLLAVAYLDRRADASP